MLVIGLTGGIGCGKSTVADIFARLGIPIIDTDQISRELTEPGQAALEAIRRRFGAEYLLPDQRLDRARLRHLVFSNPEAKRALEGILHPLIRAEVGHRLAHLDSTYVIVAIPLLFETGAYGEWINRALVVDCAEEQQVERVMARSFMKEEDVRAIMANQLPRQERLKRADDICSNSGNMIDLQEQVEALHRKYLQLAANAQP